MVDQVADDGEVVLVQGDEVTGDQRVVDVGQRLIELASDGTDESELGEAALAHQADAVLA